MATKAKTVKNIVEENKENNENVENIKDVENIENTEVVEEVKEESKEGGEDANESETTVEESKENAQSNEEAQETAQADEAAEEEEVEKVVNEVSGKELYKKYADAVKNAKQFYQCKLPSISYYSKRSLCDAVDTMKRMCDRSNGVETTNMCIELLETAIAYLYSRKVNG